MADQPKPLDGATTADDKVVFEAQRLSYEAAHNIAEKIARRISERTKGREVVIAGTQLLADFSNLVAIKAMLEELAQDYDALAELARASVPVPPHKGPLITGLVETRTPLSAVPGLGAITAGLGAVTAGCLLYTSDAADE